GEVKAKQRVVFRIHGYAKREYVGHITRVNPAANATTRQVEVLVNFADSKQEPKLAGLYAEGRIETRSSAALTVPPSAVVQDGEQAFAWRLKDQALQKVNLKLGDRDARTGEFTLKSGVSDGDMLLRYPSSSLQDGQKVEMATAADQSFIVTEGAPIPTATR